VGAAIVGTVGEAAATGSLADIVDGDRGRRDAGEMAMKDGSS